MKHFFLSFIVMLFIFGFTACDNGTDIPGDDPNNTETTADVVWKNELTLPINPALSYNYMPAVDENNNIYVLMQNFEGGLWGGYAMQKFDKDGKKLWVKQSTEAGCTPHNQMPTFYKNNLYFTTDTKVICLDASSGDSKWEYEVPDSMQYITPAIAVVNDMILITLEPFTAEKSYLFALDPASGNVTSSLGITNERVWLNMAARGNTVYLVYSDLYKVTVGAGKSLHLEWSVQLPGDDPTYYISFQNDLVISSDGNVTFAYVADRENPLLENIISYNSYGKKLWEYERANSSRLTLDKQGNVYDGGVDDLIKIDAESGQKLWATEPPSETMGFGNSFTSMVHGKDGVMYCGDVYGIYGVNLSGEVKYSLFPEKITGNTTPLTDVTLLGNGNIIVMSMDEEGGNGHIYCIKCNTGGIVAEGWPKRGGNAANTFNAQ